MTTARETADHAELARRLREDADWQRKMKGGTTNDRMPDQAADALENLLSEIAALRGEREGLRNRVSCLERLGGEQSTRVMEQATRAKDAERQRDELRKALEPFAEAAESLDDETSDYDHIWEQPAAMSIDAGHLRTARALLANQGADQ